MSDIYNRVSPYRVRLDPWYAELAMLLSSTWHCLPFAVQIPEGLAARPDEIGAFKANPARNMHALQSIMAFPKNDNVFAILFYKPDEAGLRDANSLRYFIPGLPSVIEGKTTPPPGTFHILTTLDALDLGRPVPEVRWKMSRALAATMRRERWMLVLWRMDFHSVGACPLHLPGPMQLIFFLQPLIRARRVHGCLSIHPFEGPNGSRDRCYCSLVRPSQRRL